MKYLIIAFLLLFSCVASAQQKWASISHFSSSPYSDWVYPVPYFVNEEYGFVSVTSVDSSILFRTIDGGKHWTRAGLAYADMDNPIPTSITDLFFDTPSHFFGTSASGTYGGVFETSDSGMTWKVITSEYISGYGNSFYFSKGILYSYNGTYSADDGKTWTLDYAPFWKGASAVIGNKENSIACLDGINNSTLYTTDGGITWIISSVNNLASVGYAIPHTLTYFGLCAPNPDSTFIIRSFDGGISWKNIYPMQFARPPMTIGITGSGTMLYAEQIYTPLPQYGINSSGVVRSSDLGITWDTIAGPHNNLHSHLSAVARGAICFVGDDSGRLWKYVDSSLLRNATWDLTIKKSSNALSNDTLFARTCDSAKLNLYYGFTGGDYVKLNAISVDGIPATDYRADFTQDKILMIARSDTSSITFLPSLPGTYPIKIHTYLMRDDWVREDTAFNLVLLVSPNPAVVSISVKSSIDFGKQTLCTAQTVMDSFFLSNTGCDNLQVQNMMIEVDQNPKTDFSFTSIKPFTLSRTETPQKFVVSFKPSNVGIETARIIIVSNAGLDTIELSGEGLRDNRSLTLTDDTLRAKVLLTIDGYLYFRNTGCRTVEVDSVSLASPLTLAMNQVPVDFGSGISTYLKVNVTPTQIGLQSVPFTLHAKVISPSDTVAFDTAFTVWVEGLNSLAVNNASPILLNSIRPNPAKNEIEIRMNSSAGGSATIGIFSMLGTEIYSVKKELVSGENSIQLDTQNLAEGSYLLRITSAGGSDSKIFVKLK